MELPFQYDSTTKKLSLAENVSKSDWKDLELEIKQLNTLASELISSNSDVPPPPVKELYNRQLSALSKKLFDSGSKSFKEKKFADAVKQFSLCIEMNHRRPKFESFQLTLQELIMPLMARCDSYLLSEDFINAFGDADLLCSIAANIPDNHLRRGIANFKLDNLLDAKNDFERGLLFAPDHPKLKEELAKLLKEYEERNGEAYYTEFEYAD